MSRGFLVAALMLVASPSAAQTPPIEVRAELETQDQPLGVGEPFRVSIEARHPAGGMALLPEPLELGTALAERRSARKHERRTEDGLEVDRYSLELIAFESGPQTLPAIPLAFGSTQAATRPIELVIASGLAEDEQAVAGATIAEALAELEQMAAANPNPRAIEVRDLRPVWVIGGLLLLGLFGAALFTWLRRREKRVVPPPPPPPPRPAGEVALERLEALQRAAYLSRGEHKSFHVELSEILRGYTGARWGFDSLELTTAELMLELDARSTPGLDRARLREILVLTDLVKFAKLQPAIEESERALAASFELVRSTAPRPEAERQEAHT